MYMNVYIYVYISVSSFVYTNCTSVSYSCDIVHQELRVAIGKLSDSRSDVTRQVRETHLSCTNINQYRIVYMQRYLTAYCWIYEFMWYCVILLMCQIGEASAQIGSFQATANKLDENIYATSQNNSDLDNEISILRNIMSKLGQQK